MPRITRAAVLALALLALAVACGGHSSSVSFTREALPGFVLQPQDLPSAFSFFDVGTQKAADAPPGARSDPRRFGRIEGWIARYRRSGSSTTGGPLVIESRADLFASTDGAKEDLDAYADELRLRKGGVGALALLKPHLGEAAVGGSFRQGQVVYVTIAWRESNLTASLIVSGFAGRLSTADALSLARSQDRRIVRAG